MNLPTPISGTEMYLAAVLDELKRIEAKLDALQPKPEEPAEEPETIELTEPAKPKKGKR